MMKSLSKPLPKPTQDTTPFWEGCKNHKLLLQKCKECEDVRFPASIMCPSCGSLDYEWMSASGKGEVWSHVIFHLSYHPAYERLVPYGVAIVELEEGVRMVTNIVGCPPEEIHIGMPVEVFFDDVSENIALPKFKAVRGSDSSSAPAPQASPEKDK